MNWKKTLFLHTGWASKYDGTEFPRGGHAYLKTAVGVEAENFKPVGGWCYGYAPVSRMAGTRGLKPIPKAGRTLNINKLGAPAHWDEISGITVIWTARKPDNGPVIVGLYDNATVLRFIPPYLGDERVFIAKARAENCRLIPADRRRFAVIQKKKGYPGMAAAWFPGEHREGPAREFLAEVADYLPFIRKLRPVNSSKSG